MKCPCCKQKFEPLHRNRRYCYDPGCVKSRTTIENTKFKKAHPNYQKDYYGDRRQQKIDYSTNWKLGLVGKKHKTEFARIEASDLAVMRIVHRNQSPDLQALVWQGLSPEKFARIANQALKG